MNRRVQPLGSAFVAACFVHATIAFFFSTGADCMVAAPQEEIADLQTVAESSEFTATSRFQDVVAFVDQCAAASHVQRVDFGRSVEGRAMVATVVANPPWEMGANDDPRLRILLLGNIHSGECAGKEALLAMLRELAADSGHPWLADCVIVIAPNYNVDANERVGPGANHRPGQAGPEQGMGQRENPQQLDLNRDFVKLESPEARSLVSLIDSFDPHMFIDCHTTNGSIHQYKLTYDIPHNPTTPQAIRDYLRNNMMPSVTSALEKEGLFAFFYGNFSRDRTQWTTYGHEPRYSTEYVGLRGRLGILSEAYSYATYQERIAATDSFVRQCVEHVRANGDDVKNLLADVREQDIATAKTQPEKTLIHLQSTMVPFEGTYKIRGYDGEEKKDYEVSFIGDFRPTTSVSLPFAYVLPQELSLHAERLQMHGIQVEQVSEANEIPSAEGTVYTVTEINRSPRTFQKHNMVTLETTSEKRTVGISPNSFLIRTSQPLGRLASYMLEPETNEGFVTWNFLDEWLSVGSDYPVIRIDSPIQMETIVVEDIQPGQKLRLADIFGDDKIQLPAASLSDVQWLGDGNSYSVAKNGRRIAVDVGSGAESRLPVPFEIGDVISAMGEFDGVGRREIMELLSEGIDLRGDEQKLFLLNHKKNVFVFDAESKAAIRLGTDDAPAELADLNPSGDKVAFVQNNNLMLLEKFDAPPVTITDDGSETIFNGKLDWVYQEELYGRGNFKSFWWSPDGNSIAWLRTDEAPVNKFTVTDHLPVRGRLEVTAYPKAGDPLPVVSVSIYRLSEKATVQIALPEQPAGDGNELLISRVTWDPTNQTVLLQLQNRIQSWLDLCRVDATSGKLSVLFRDQTPAWIGTPGDPEILPDGSFLWLSPRSGYKAIYRYSADGKEMAQLTSDDWEVRSLLGCDFAKQLVYFTGSPDTPTRVTGMSVRLDGTDMAKLLAEPGYASLKFNKGFTHFLAQVGTAVNPDQLALHEASGQMVRSVIPVRDDRLRHIAMTPPEFIEIPIGEGDESVTMDAMLIRPAGFDPANSYPMLVHVYGGPQTPRVRDRFGGDNYLWHQYLAQQGYVVFIVDNRSASYRSVKQAWPVYRDMARRELADIEWAIRWLQTDNVWIDSDRIGLWGWSYGGYMTAYALTHSKTFRCGISGAPVTDWRNYDAIYTERFMDTPQNNPQGYADSSVLKAVDNLHGELLLVHGTIDDNVHVSNTMQLVNALQHAGKQFELMVYPNNRHHFREPKQSLHLYELMTDFLKRKL